MSLPRFMAKDAGEDSRPRGKRMQVIAAGLPRCGTSSLQRALESSAVGLYPCMHMSRVMPSIERMQTTIAIMKERDQEKRQAMVAELFDGYLATTDFPGSWMILDLMDVYPDAVIILNQRPPGSTSWLQSMRGVMPFFRSWTYRICCFPVKVDRLGYELHGIFWKEMSSHYGMKDITIEEFYDFFQELVIREAKKRGRKLLVWNVKDGWGPLCEFLGKEPPNEPFPFDNEQATFKLIQKVILARGVLAWALIGAGVFAASSYGGPVVRRLLSAASVWRSALGR